MRVSKGIITAYDAANHKADVLLVGSLSRVALGVPVAQEVAPELVAENTACGVMFFGEGDPGVVVCTFADGAAWGDRGWRDDFLGDSLHPQYAGVATSGGTAALLSDAHGGVLRLSTTATAGSEYILYLGDPAGAGRGSLDADEGWAQICTFRVNSIAGSLNAAFGARDNSNNEVILAGVSQVGGVNQWSITTRAGGGAVTYSWSGVPIDTDWHCHRLDVYPADGGHRADYWVDAKLMVTTQANITTASVTPYCVIYVSPGAVRNMDVDYWAVIPR